MDFFLELYGGLPRGGPGDDAHTLKALAMVGGLDASSLVLDVGCGQGVQTVTLLKGMPVRGLGFDLHDVMLGRARTNSESAGVSDRLRLVRGDMHRLRFADGAFDVVWSEGGDLYDEV